MDDASDAWDLQYRSPSPSAFSGRLPSFDSSRRPHSHAGYSLSSIASGGSLFLKYPRPFNGVPAGTELLEAGTSAVVEASAGRCRLDDVENGCKPLCLHTMAGSPP